MATIQMIKGDLLADIFDSPETIAQARREGYSLVDPADITKLDSDLEQLTKAELLELARQKGVFEKSLAPRRKDEIIEVIKAARPEEPETRGQDTAAAQASTEPPAGEGAKPEGPDVGGETPANPNEKRGFFGGKK